MAKEDIIKHQFKKGNPGRPKGSRNKLTVQSQRFAEEVLHIDPDTLKEMTPKEIREMIAMRAAKSDRILMKMLDHFLGLPTKRHEVKTNTVILEGPNGEPIVKKGNKEE